jgi:hypothetical protein
MHLLIAGRRLNFENGPTGCRPFQQDDLRDRPAKISDDITGLDFGSATR